MKYIKLFENFSIDEDTSATGGAPSSGMGAVVNAQPSSLPGTTIGTNWSDTGGKVGSGDIGVPYGIGGNKFTTQKIGIMGYNHGPRTGKKSREKKVDIKAIRDMLKNKDSKNSKKIMNFDDFEKSDIEKIKR